MKIEFDFKGHIAIDDADDECMSQVNKADIENVLHDMLLDEFGGKTSVTVGSLHWSVKTPSGAIACWTINYYPKYCPECGRKLDDTEMRQQYV